MEGSRRKNRLPAPERPTTAPPGSSATANGSGSSSASIESGKIDLSDLDTATVDQEALFSTSTDWNLLGKAMAVLQDQYDQCLQDIAQLEALKLGALSDPKLFVRGLSGGTVNPPTLQTIYRIPEVETECFAVRASRRGLSKKEQNIEFLLGRLKELQQRGSVVLPVPLRSDQLVVGDASEDGRAAAKTKSNAHRDKYLSVIEPAGTPTITISSTPTSPPNSSSNNNSSSSNNKRRTKQHSSHTHNVPWTKQEKLRLNELLSEYPEEPVAARRYAKIAAALGTRTATQVFTRVSKLIANKRAFNLVSDDSDPNESTDASTLKQRAEYAKLKQALEQELSGAGTAQVHCGVSCGECHAHPIVGIRYRCSECVLDLCDACFVPGQSARHSTHRVQTVPVAPLIDSTIAEFDYLTN